MPKLQFLDSNEFLFKSLRHYIAEIFLAIHYIQKNTSKECTFWSDISLHGPMGPHGFPFESHNVYNSRSSNWLISKRWKLWQNNKRNLHLMTQ